MSKVEGSGKRPKTGGRVKGTPNKLTQAAKDAIATAFEDLGGTDALVEWAKLHPDNRKVFYSQIWPKIVPLQVSGEGGGPVQYQEIRRTIVRP